MDLSAITQANMRPADLAWLLRVNRSTCSLWLNGHTNPHPLLEPRVKVLCDAVKKALAAKLLPLEDGLRGDTRKRAIQKALQGFLPKK